MFNRRELQKMIIPLFFEQLLVMLVGMADTLVVSFAGEAAVSGVSLVNQFNTIFIYLFTALASGGAVVISQYIGRADRKNSVLASGQLLRFSVVLSVVLGGVVLAGNRMLLGLMFGKVAPDVMEACVTYLRISAYSYPALAVYNAGASLQRSLGKTKTTMYVSLVSNIINLVGNAIGVFVLHAGVAGVAWPSLIARTFSAVAMTVLCFNSREEAYFEKKTIFRHDGEMLRKILGIAVPNGIENAVFQLVKVGLSSVVALFGTYQIAANGIAQSFWSFAAIMGLSMQPVYTTVIGRCMGAGDVQGAEQYFHKLNKLTLVLSLGWNLLVAVIAMPVLQLYSLEDQTRELVFVLILIHNLFNSLVYPFFGPLGVGLRAAGDVKYTMTVSILSTLLGRLLFSFIFALVFHWGVIGIALAMAVDWCLRGALFYWRMRSKKWAQFQVI